MPAISSDRAGTSHSPDQERQRAKRRRIGYACDQCRTKKNRCDGERPVCGPCGLRQLACVYSGQKSRTIFTQQYVDTLKARNIILERQLAAQVSNAQQNFPPPSTVRGSAIKPPTPATSQLSLPDDFNVISTAFPQSSAPVTTDCSLPNSPSLQVEIQSRPDLHREEPRSGTPLVGMSRTYNESSHSKDEGFPDFGEETAVSQSGEKSTEYFGESSTFDFMTKVCSPDVEPPNGTLGSVQTQSRPQVATSVDLSSPAASVSDRLILGTGSEDEFGLPHRSVADKLVDAYFKYRHPLNPHLHEHSFRKRYENLWLSEEFGGEAATDDNLGWLGLVNLVFAFGCDHTKALRRVSIDRTRFFKRGKALIFSGVLQPSKIELVQALLLTGQYLHGSLELNACWTVVGLAIRMAQGLGLHLDPGNFTSEIVQQEVRKRVWWGCFVIDRILCMKVGRPPTIHDDVNIKVGLPLAIDDEYLTNDKEKCVTQPQELPSKLDFLLQVIPLCRLIDRIRETLYSGGQVDLSKKRMGDIPTVLSLSIQLDGEFTSWEKKLPPHLRFDSDIQDWHFARQRSTLLMRFLNARLLLHRQILLVYVTCRMKDSFQRELVHCCVRRCIMAAHETICQVRLLHERRSLHSWWHHSHFIFAALGVMLAFRTLDAQKKKDIRLCDSMDIDQAIMDGTRLLEEVGNQLHPLATRYLQSHRRLESRLQEASLEKLRMAADSRARTLRSVTPTPDIGERTELPNPQLSVVMEEDLPLQFNSSDETSMIFDDDFSEFENIFCSTGWSGLIDDWNESWAS